MQVARVPTERENTPSMQSMITGIMARLQASPDSLDRTALDEFLFEMMHMTEDYGLQSAPRWPAISMTPLAIYRQVPPAPSFSEDDNDS
jgi:hypothetical protein